MAQADLYCLPSLLRGNGTGHLVRCSRIVDALDNGILCLPEVDLPGFFTTPEVEKILFRRLEPGKIQYSLPEKTNSLVLLDRRECDDTLWNSLPRGCRTIGIDEGGPFRAEMDYLFDTLPGRRYRVEPHQRGLHLLGRPEKRRNWPTKLSKVLIAFGGEDPARLTEKTLAYWEGLRKSRGISLPEIWVCRGFLGERKKLSLPVHLLSSQGDLKNRLADFDLVLTSYGLTAFEALGAGVPVILKDPSPYHRALTAGANLPSLGRGGQGRLRKMVADFPALVKRCRRWEENSLGKDLPPPLTEQLALLRFPETRCPGCGHSPGRSHRILLRLPHRTFRRCGLCGLVYQILHRPVTQDYGEEYFFEHYARQYGRSYLEDFPHLRTLARDRLRILGGLLSPGACLLDIGCAYGAFLLEAREAGYDALGIDLAPSAVEYVTGTLKLPAEVLPAENLRPDPLMGRSRIHAFTLWYVIEHFQELDRFLHSLSQRQRRGDILAFSTPNLRGVSGRLYLEDFLSRSPQGHHHIWDPRTARTLLTRYGYRIRRIRITGHHPERFPRMARRTSASPLFRVCRAFSLWAGWGETFEVYAEKVREGTGR